MLRDLRIAQDVIIAIVYQERVPVVSLDVMCDKGAVALRGAVRFAAAADRCVETAGTVEGVDKVVSYLEVVEYAYYAGM
jgi:osmotically-inducible protein OsmY